MTELHAPEPRQLDPQLGRNLRHVVRLRHLVVVFKEGAGLVQSQRQDAAEVAHEHLLVDLARFIEEQRGDEQHQEQFRARRDVQGLTDH